MTERIKRYSVVLRYPFDPGGDNGMQPAGTYDIETVEEQLDSISFIAFRRLSTMMSRQPTGGEHIGPGAMMINPADLELALANDRVEIAQSGPGI
jgi:hypothetical protein